MDLSREWYITTNGTTFSTFLLSKTLWSENLTLLVLVSISFCGYPFCENHDFISQICFSNLFLLRKFDAIKMCTGFTMDDIIMITMCAVSLANHLRGVADMFCPLRIFFSCVGINARLAAEMLRIHQRYWATQRWTSQKWSLSNR